MIKHDPKQRPDTHQILKHPYFWPVEDKLDFLCEVSDCYEKEKNSIKNIHNENAARTPDEQAALFELAQLQQLASNVIGRTTSGALQDFLRVLPRNFLTEMGKQRKYTGTKMIDLLRVIRNKKNHMMDLPQEVREHMRSLDERGCRETGEVVSKKAYYEFWASKFPALLVNCHMLIAQRGLVEKMGLKRFY
jgi:serine/threonine-protein kinase/endoribonuclease IRE1